MELTVHITYFPMEAQYGASLWQDDKMIDIDYQLYDTKEKAQKVGEMLRQDYNKLSDAVKKGN